MTKTKLQKKIREMTAEEKDSLLLSLYQHEPKLFSFYFGDKTYREEVLSEYKKKIEKIFNPSERALMTKGVDTPAAIALVQNFEDVAFTGDEDLNDYYKNEIKLYFTLEGASFLASYGGGPDELYDAVSDYFSQVCSYIKEGEEKGIDEVISFADEHFSDFEKIVSLGDECGMEELEDMWGRQRKLLKESFRMLAILHSSK